MKRIIFMILLVFYSGLVYAEEKPATKEGLEKISQSKKPVMLLAQNGKEIDIDSLIGKALVMTFIYTRCPSPTKCPLIMSRMVKLRKELVDYEDRVNFAIVSVDPEYDTPVVLKEYSEINGADFSNFLLLTGTRKNVDQVIKHFKVYIEEEEPGIISHSLDTFLMDKKGIIRKIWPGAFWDVDAAADDVVKLLEEEKKGALLLE